jgi:Pyruvate-formate lyase-activating enzyme
MKCLICGEGEAAEVLGVCLSCIRERPEEAKECVKRAHVRARAPYALPPEPPRSKDPDARRCRLCANECLLAPGEVGYCGVRKNQGSKIGSVFPQNYGLLYAYEDPLPTNCCASWFCPESEGENVAVFFYGCNFDCLFCQNESHKQVQIPPMVSLESFVSRIEKNRRARCVCYFGGSPEPQLPFAIEASERLLYDGGPRICWEGNGCGNPAQVRKAASLSLRSGGIVKFDLKAFGNDLSVALCGVSNRRVFQNFEMIAGKFFEGSDPPVLMATTLLVPHYIDEVEVEKTAEFIASLDPGIPYSLLVFHPAFCMNDLPVTPRSQVERCYEAAKRHLERVYVGNKHLLAMALP